MGGWIDNDTFFGWTVPLKTFQLADDGHISFPCTTLQLLFTILFEIPDIFCLSEIWGEYKPLIQKVFVFIKHFYCIVYCRAAFVIHTTFIFLPCKNILSFFSSFNPGCKTVLTFLYTVQYMVVLFKWCTEISTLAMVQGSLRNKWWGTLHALCLCGRESPSSVCLCVYTWLCMPYM